MSHLFIDIDTQKCFIEHFGDRAIPDCPEIRENLMGLAGVAIKQRIPMASFVVPGSEKLSETEIEEHYEIQTVFEHGDEVWSNEFEDYLNDLGPDSLFVFGVPLETSVKEFVLRCLELDLKVWVVRDAVKAYDADHEPEILAELKEAGAKLVDTRNLEKFVCL